jgi:acyl carrier protein
MTGIESPGGPPTQAKDIQRSADSFATETERKVAQIFAETLELQWVSADDDIFSLGGDSFEAVRIALELEYHFNIELPVELLEKALRVRDLAAWIDTLPRVVNTN